MVKKAQVTLIDQPCPAICIQDNFTLKCATTKLVISPILVFAALHHGYRRSKHCRSVILLHCILNSKIYEVLYSMTNV